MRKVRFLNFLLLQILPCISLYAQSSIYEIHDPKTVEYSKTDFGKMWTFDALPAEYFESEYGFRITGEWAERVRKAGLQFGSGCSAAFVSEDGLILTNHHCARGKLKDIQREGEHLLRDGFYARTIEEERQVPGLYVDQLIDIIDVTGEIHGAFNKGETDAEKIRLRDEKIEKIETEYGANTGLICKVVKLYEGGKYSLYTYKRYDDLRLVMSPDFQIASTGWDWDNFTYPRYELDFMFFRAYDEEGKPCKTPDFFPWSRDGADEGELIFSVGRPGDTDRLQSYSQLEYYRDKFYPARILLYNEIYKVFSRLYEKYPERGEDLLNSVMRFGNSRKSYAGSYIALKNEHIMRKKIDFENELKSRVASDPESAIKYGGLWDSINARISVMREYFDEYYAFRIPRSLTPVYFEIAEAAIELSESMNSADNADESKREINISEFSENIFPAEIDSEKENMLLAAAVNYVSGVLGPGNTIANDYFNGKRGEDAAEYLIRNSVFTDRSRFLEFMSNDFNEIDSLKDPILNLIRKFRTRTEEIRPIFEKTQDGLSVLNQQLGKVIYDIYGESLPPDATSTLRLSDGIIAGYEYNGTIAPGVTTFYGLYDRYFSFGGETYPWGLHERWRKIPGELDLSTPVCFASTNDIVGGNSGSSVINTKGEVVGVLHDGNLESLAGDFLYVPEVNRAVASDSRGILEALKHVFHAGRLVNELLNSRLSGEE